MYTKIDGMIWLLKYETPLQQDYNENWIVRAVKHFWKTVSCTTYSWGPSWLDLYTLQILAIAMPRLPKQ